MNIKIFTGGDMEYDKYLAILDQQQKGGKKARPKPQATEGIICNTSFYIT